MSFIKPKINQIVNTKKVVSALILAVFVYQAVIPVGLVQAHGITLAKNSQNSRVLAENITNKMFLKGLMLEDRKPDKVVGAVLTAYSSTVDQCDSDPFIAASGKHVYDGMIAANFLPFGTKVKIPSLFGDKVFTVDDRMNARYGFGRVDIWMDAPRAEVNAFGVKRAEIEIYYPEKDTKIVKTVNM
jgi:hypothetical protein